MASTQIEILKPFARDFAKFVSSSILLVLAKSRKNEKDIKQNLKKYYEILLKYNQLGLAEDEDDHYETKTIEKLLGYKIIINKFQLFYWFQQVSEKIVNFLEIGKTSKSDLTDYCDKLLRYDGEQMQSIVFLHRRICF
jgi:hypothetical protein